MVLELKGSSSEPNEPPPGSAPVVGEESSDIEIVDQEEIDNVGMKRGHIQLELAFVGVVDKEGPKMITLRSRHQHRNIQCRRKQQW